MGGPGPAGAGVRGGAELRLGRLKPDTTGSSHGRPASLGVKVQSGACWNLKLNITSLILLIIIFIASRDLWPHLDDIALIDQLFGV